MATETRKRSSGAWFSVGGEAQGAAEGGRLRLGQPAGQPQHGPQQLVQRGVGQLGLDSTPPARSTVMPSARPAACSSSADAGAGLATDHQAPPRDHGRPRAAVQGRRTRRVCRSITAMLLGAGGAHRRGQGGDAGGQHQQDEQARPRPTWSARRPMRGGSSRNPP